MKKYNLYYVTGGSKLLFKSNITEEQVDKFWNSLKWWEKSHIEVEEIKNLERSSEDDGR